MNKKALAEKYVFEGYDYFNNQDLDRAEIAYKKAIKAYPEYEIAHLNLGNVYLNRNDYTKAINSYKRALKIRPSYPMAETNMAVAYSRSGNFKKALEHLQNVLETRPDYNMTYIYLGNILLFQGSYLDAEMCYKMAVEKDREYSESHNNLGVAQVRLLKLDDAVKSFKKAIKLGDKTADTYTNLGTAYGKLKKTGPAINALKKAIEINPNDSIALGTLSMQLRAACDWDELGRIEPRVRQVTRFEIKNKIKPGVDPFLSVIKDAKPKENYEIAKLWSDHLVESITLQKKFKYKPKKNKKIRIGYVSAHLHDHPTAYLIHTMLGYHDREKFEVYTYSFGPQDKSFHRSQMMTNSDFFKDVTFANFSDIASGIHNDKIDILIDLDGYTDNKRLEIFALRPAPVQISFLGFPGTTGSSFLDYIITDKVVTPSGQQKFYSEKFISLPPTYQVNDENLLIDKKYKRSKFKISEKAVVFASFNGNYKIEPEAYDVWMDILKATPKGILWLLKSSPLSEKNLKKEAEKRGVNPKRIVMSPMLKRNKHLARMKLADIALDTFTCNGHTTTSDALWTGIPVITLRGKHFTSRVASSILTSAGLEELISSTPKEYKKLAITLGNNPKKLKALKKKLEDNKSNKPFFDTKLYTENIEKGYLKAWENHKRGRKPSPIIVK